ncbi:MAG TPA: hypothetical protein VMI53_08190 [Opitutaceae bacterium]|nr:hypothetical protein [Opitutaceae bacterium]
MSSQQLNFSTDFTLRTAVRSQPEFDLSAAALRPEMLARGRLLAVDPSYPPAKVILIVGKRLVKLVR